MGNFVKIPGTKGTVCYFPPTFDCSRSFFCCQSESCNKTKFHQYLYIFIKIALQLKIVEFSATASELIWKERQQTIYMKFSVYGTQKAFKIPCLYLKRCSYHSYTMQTILALSYPAPPLNTPPGRYHLGLHRNPCR